MNSAETEVERLAKLPERVWLDPETQEREFIGDDVFAGTYGWYVSDGDCIPNGVEYIRADLLRQQAEEIERLRGWVNDLQSGMYINCVYCGHRYGPNDKVPAAMADVLKAHVEVCPEHPMSALTRQLQEAERIIDDFYGAWIGRNNAGQLNGKMLDRAMEAARAFTNRSTDDD